MAVCFQIGDNLQCRFGRQCTPSSAVSTGLGPVDKHTSNADVLTAIRVLSIIELLVCFIFERSRITVIWSSRIMNICYQTLIALNLCYIGTGDFKGR